MYHVPRHLATVNDDSQLANVLGAVAVAWMAYLPGLVEFCLVRSVEEQMNGECRMALNDNNE